MGNPGWWVGLHWDLPPLAHREAVPLQVHCPAANIEEGALQSVADILQMRLLRADIAELAARAAVDTGVDPLAMSVLRNRILSGGAVARRALWRISLDPSIPGGERLQAVLTLAQKVGEDDAEGFSALAGEPDRGLRMEAALAMGSLPAERSRPILERLILDPDDAVRATARAMLRR